MSTVTLTEQKSESRGKTRDEFTIEGTSRGTLRALFNAIYCREGMTEDASALVCGDKKSEKWCRKMADYIEDFLRLGGDNQVNVPTGHMKIMREAHKALGNFKPKGARKVLVKEYSKLLEILRGIDDLWSVLNDTTLLGGCEIDLMEMRNLVAWLRKCRGGFTLRGAD